MALSKFLFTSSERKEALLAPLKSAGDVFSKSKKRTRSKLDKVYEIEKKYAPDEGNLEKFSASMALIGSGIMVGITSPLGLLGLLGEYGGKVLYQEMYLNPDSMSISYSTSHSKKELLGGVVVNHYRTQVPIIRLSGAVGWIRLESRLDSAINSALDTLLSGGSAKKVGGAFANQWKDLSFKGNFLKNLKRTREQLRNVVNSPRKFMDELQHLALSPMYYRDSRGIERYNLKEIVIFTKRYPNGAVLQGYFDQFSFEEKGKDSETIKYSLQFVALNIKPVGLAERLGQFIAPFYGVGLELGGIIGL